jgi:hypothetical protein
MCIVSAVLVYVVTFFLSEHTHFLFLSYVQRKSLHEAQVADARSYRKREGEMGGERESRETRRTDQKERGESPGRVATSKWHAMYRAPVLACQSHCHLSHHWRTMHRAPVLKSESQPLERITRTVQIGMLQQVSLRVAVMLWSASMAPSTRLPTSKRLTCYIASPIVWKHIVRDRMRPS